MARGRNLPCPGVPRKAPLLTMTLPREMVVTGIPTTSHPSYELYCTFMCRVWGDTRSRAVGSMSTMSADPAHEGRSEEHTSELQSRPHLVCRLLLEKKKK